MRALNESRKHHMESNNIIVRGAREHNLQNIELELPRNQLIVFTGVSGAGNLKSVLATLEPKQQALILGYAVPMPVVVRTRAYDEVFYKAMGTVDAAEARRRAAQDRDELFPD